MNHGLGNFHRDGNYACKLKGDRKEYKFQQNRSAQMVIANKNDKEEEPRKIFLFFYFGGLCNYLIMWQHQNMHPWLLLNS